MPRRRKPRPIAPSPERPDAPIGAPKNAAKARPASAGATAPRAHSGRQPGAVWLFGRHAVLAAVGNPERQIHRLLALEAAREPLSEAVARATRPRPELETVDRLALERRLPPGAVHQGMAALAAPLAEPDLETLLADLEAVPEAVVVVLDQASDPRNVGAVLRSAAAFGARALIVQSRHAPPASAALAKAASGALEVVPLVRVVNVARALRALGQEGFFRLGLDAAASETLAASLAASPGRVALVLGSEGQGLRRLVGEACDAHARIPILPAAESLNLSAAAAIALYEILRARSAPPL